MVYELEVNNLHVEVDGKKVLNGVDLELEKGEVRAIIGPNASGKSTLASTIMGIPRYKILDGKILFRGKDITGKKLNERAKLGIAMAFQHPPEIKGVKLSKLIERIKNVEKVDYLGHEELVKRHVNVGFSGGEKKFSELIQLVNMDPELVILDEIDSGLDVKNLEEVVKIIKEFFVKKDKTLLVITHRGRILRLLKPSKVSVMLDGRIICTSEDWEKVWNTVSKHGFRKCRECGLLSG